MTESDIASAEAKANAYYAEYLAAYDNWDSGGATRALASYEYWSKYADWLRTRLGYEKPIADVGKGLEAAGIALAIGTIAVGFLAFSTLTNGEIHRTVRSLGSSASKAGKLW